MNPPEFADTSQTEATAAKDVTLGTVRRTVWAEPTSRTASAFAGGRRSAMDFYPLPDGGSGADPVDGAKPAAITGEFNGVLAMKKVFTTGQVAKICKVAPRTVSKWFDSGKLRGYRIPGSQDRRIPREHLIRFLKEHHMPLGELEEEEWHKLLLIGAERLFIDRIQELLPENEEYRYQIAQSGFEAGIQAESFHPDSIVIDMALGRSEAVQITVNLRKNPAYEHTIIIGLAGEDEAEPDKLIEHGYSEIFKKPFDVALLAERIRTIADAKRQE